MGEGEEEGRQVARDDAVGGRAARGGEPRGVRVVPGREGGSRRTSRSMECVAEARKGRASGGEVGAPARQVADGIEEDRVLGADGGGSGKIGGKGMGCDASGRGGNRDEEANERGIGAEETEVG